MFQLACSRVAPSIDGVLLCIYKYIFVCVCLSVYVTIYGGVVKQVINYNPALSKFSWLRWPSGNWEASQVPKKCCTTSKYCAYAAQLLLHAAGWRWLVGWLTAWLLTSAMNSIYRQKKKQSYELNIYIAIKIEQSCPSKNGQSADV